MDILVRNIAMSVERDEKTAIDIAKKRLKDKCKIRGTDAYIFRRSIDARKSEIRIVYSVCVRTEESVSDTVLAAADCVRIVDSAPCSPENIVRGDETCAGRPVVVGFGPCGMFASLLMAECGMKPIVIERGNEPHARKEKIDLFYKTRVLDTETNIQFGAGGAGTFSDGKLITGINDEKCRYVLRRLHDFGAPEEILVSARPHIGTDKLLHVVENIRRKIEELGGEIRFDTKMTGIKTSGGRAVAVSTSDGDIPCGPLVLAIGHSARDTYKYLMGQGFDIVPKPFSVGVRIEHLTSDIDRALYGDHAGNPKLGHAEYNLSKRFGDRGVYTFCMCPGGEVMAATSEQGGVVTNGMSRYLRDGVNSNAAIAVSVVSDDPIEYQRSLERAAFEAGGGDFAAPVQTVGDFIEGVSAHEPSRVLPSYMNGNVRPFDLNKILPPDISSGIKIGLTDFDRRIKGYAAPDAVLTGLETRTSAPVRIMRSKEFLATGSDNIYPGGEGAGYAGGITSAAVDGLRIALAILGRYANP